MKKRLLSALMVFCMVLTVMYPLRKLLYTTKRQDK